MQWPLQSIETMIENNLQRYQEDHIDEVEIISLRKRCNKAGAKAGTKAEMKNGTEAPRSR